MTKEQIINYIDRLLNCGLGKKKSLEFLKKYIMNETEISCDRNQCYINGVNDINCDECLVTQARLKEEIQ